MKRVFICSQLRGYFCNRARAIEYCKWATNNHDVAVFAPHCFYTQFLNDSVEADRGIGINAGIAFLEACHELWAFVVDGVVSEGMQEEVRLAHGLSIPVRWFAVEFSLTNNFTITALHHLPTDTVPKSSELLPTAAFVSKASDTFADVEAKLKSGASYEDLVSDLDQVLGTEMADRNKEAEEAWENSRDEQ